jgi:hypothetical protein
MWSISTPFATRKPYSSDPRVVRRCRCKQRSSPRPASASGPLRFPPELCFFIVSQPKGSRAVGYKVGHPPRRYPFSPPSLNSFFFSLHQNTDGLLHLRDVYVPQYPEQEPRHPEEGCQKVHRCGDRIYRPRRSPTSYIRGSLSTTSTSPLLVTGDY